MNHPLALRYKQEAVSSLPKNDGLIRTAWRSPSNIALVKYWGKKEGQIPENPSLSFSLSESVTEMRLEATIHSGFSFEYYFEGKQIPGFADRIGAYLKSILPYFPFLKGLNLRIESSNTFPHSSGIASSASSMSALALCLCSMEEKMLGRRREEDFYRKVSFMARLGSGSAARSVYGGFCSWGRTGLLQGTDTPDGSDEYASPVHLDEESVFADLRDAVLIVSPETKSVASSAGHGGMMRHPFAAVRYKQAAVNHSRLLQAIRQNDTGEFMRITENEALTLHSLMMSSDPGFVLLHPGSIEIIKAIRSFREETGAFLTFTIDAGPNIHLIYPEAGRQRVHKFISAELSRYCHEGSWIDDHMGAGPVELSI